MPVIIPMPMLPNSGPSPVIGKPPVQSIVSPRAMLNMPRVATNGGSLKRVIARPLNSPQAAPANRPATTAPNTVKSNATPSGAIGIPFFNSPAAMALDSARIAPTERSIPLVKMISVIPIERQRLTEICRKIFSPLSVVRNLSDNILITKTISTIAIKG